MSAVARLSAVAGDDITIVVRFPAGFTAGKTFALQLRRRNGALVHTATPTVAGDDAIIEIPAATSAAFRAGWLHGHLQVATPTVETLFRLDLLIEADLTGGTGPVGGLPTTPSVSTVTCIVNDTPIEVTVQLENASGASGGGIEFQIGPPPPASDPVDPDGPNCLACFDPEGGPTGEGIATLSFAIEGFWSPAIPFYIPAGLGAPPPGALDPASYDRLYIETDTPTLWMATPDGWVAVTGGGGGVTAHADLTGRTAADSHPQSAITGLTSALAEKLSAASNLSDLTDVAAAIDNLGLVGPNQPHGYAELNGAGTLPDVLVPASIARDSEVTAAIEAAQYTDEQARDVVASALVAGSNITITVDDLANTITIGSTGPAGPTGVPVTAISTSNVSKTSNVTPAAHAQLKVECAANGLYLIRANIHYGGVQTGMVALGFSGPTGAATVGGMSALGIPNGSSNSPQYAYVGTGTTTFGLGQTAIFGGPGNSGGVDRRAHAIIEAVVQMSSTAGDISVIWAQGASNVTASTVFAGSTLTVTKIG